ncbi:hypothetical protein EV361DRAFT_953604 [Lentinula raphanica]|nr:hypothetical protein EV361DRAFT_953604 [Lentinula raphanica]
MGGPSVASSSKRKLEDVPSESQAKKARKEEDSQPVQHVLHLTLPLTDPEFSTTIDRAFTMYCKWAAIVARHSRPRVRLPRPVFIERIHPHCLLLYFEGSAAETFYSIWMAYNHLFTDLALPYTVPTPPSTPTSASLSSPSSSSLLYSTASSSSSSSSSALLYSTMSTMSHTFPSSPSVLLPPPPDSPDSPSVLLQSSSLPHASAPSVLLQPSPLLSEVSTAPVGSGTPAATTTTMVPYVPTTTTVPRAPTTAMVPWALPMSTTQVPLARCTYYYYYCCSGISCIYDSLE